MAELRTIDPATLAPNPDNPRRAPVPKAQDDQLAASIRAVGIIQPPRVVDRGDGALAINAGTRRVRAAIALGLDRIEVLVCTPEEAADAMRAVSENLVRASMGSVDIWRATERLEAQGWSEQAVADALALPVRTVRRLKLLARIHPPMLDAMAAGAVPNEDQLRAIAGASAEEQAQVWKKHRPKKAQAANSGPAAAVAWHEVARALSRRRMPAAAAKFGEDLARAYGVVWEDDLFAPAGEDGRYTTNVEGFFAAQQEWLQANLPERGTIVPVTQYGAPELPKRAQRVWGKPGKGDTVGHYVDDRTGDVVTVAYRMPEEPRKTGKGSSAGAAEPPPPARARADITQRGVAMIGALRTEALREAVLDTPAEDTVLLGLLVLAFAGDNVSVQAPGAEGRHGRRAIAAPLAAGGVLTADADRVRRAARETLAAVLSLRDDATGSGPLAVVVGAAVGADARVAHMATEEFLSCLSKAALERAAAGEDVLPRPTVKATRAAMVERLKDRRWVHPSALFRLSPEAAAGLVDRAPAAAAAPADPRPRGEDAATGGDAPGPEDAEVADAGSEYVAAAAG